MKNVKLLYPLLIIISGIATGFSVILPQYFGAVAWFSMAPALYVLLIEAENGAKRRRLYGMGLLYFMSYYIVNFHWFCYLYPLDFTGLDNFSSILVIIVAWFGLSLLQALGGALTFPVCGGFARIGAFKRIPLSAIAVFPLVYSVFEYSQTIGWWGVPWGRLSLSQIEFLPIISSSAVLGSYAVTALVVLVNTSIAFGIVNRKNIKLWKIAASVSTVCFIVNLLVGGIIYGARVNNYENAEKIKVAAIQGNFSSTDKWNVTAEETLIKYENITRSAAIDGAEIILWPETAIPYNVYPESSIARRIERLAEELDVSIIVGSLCSLGDNLYNRLYNVSPTDGMSLNSYDKRHLVPFGEYVPMRAILDVLLPFLSDISILEEDMTPGDDASVMDVEGVKVGCLICFDSIYEELTIDSVRNGAEVIMISTNDSWFYDSVAIYMHNNQARLRAIESGRCILRAANTGVSTVISYSGDVKAELEPLVEGYISGEITTNDTMTPYTLIGNLFIHLSTALLAGFFIAEAIVEHRKNKGDACLGTKG